MDAQILTQAILQLPASGKKSFEELTAKLLFELTGQRFRLAKSGYQAGRDMTSRTYGENVVAVECKRYGSNTELNQRQLLGEISEITRVIPDLDLWVLVTSREIDSVLYEELLEACKLQGVDFLSIADNDGDPSSLATLCANSTELVLEFFVTNEIDTNFEQLRDFLSQTAQRRFFDSSLSTLKLKLSSPLIGYENWCTQQNSMLANMLKSHDLSRARLGQDLGVATTDISLIERNKVWSDIDSWYEDWDSTRSPLSVLGEEGDGKTWCVAAWLYDKMTSDESSFPGVVWLPSFEGIESGPEKLLSEAIVRILRTDRADFWQRKLRRWLSSTPSNNPMLILVIDGINQHYQNEQWLRLFEELVFDPTYQNQIAVIVTCRTAAWDQYYKDRLYSRFLTATVEPYDDYELEKALSVHKLSSSDYPTELMQLVRKPRYFDLMVKHREKMAESGDVTVERLVYEDWKDRYSRKTRITMGDEQFQDFISQLAESFRNNSLDTRLSEIEISRRLPPLETSGQLAVLDELITGGIFKRDGRKYIIDDKVVSLGLALLLVDQMHKAHFDFESINEVEEYLAEWFEPLSEADLKAEILGYACLHVLRTQVLGQEAKAAIVHTWISSLNPSLNIEGDFISYLPLDVDTYMLIAEIVWSDRTENKWAQDLILRSIRRWAGAETVSVQLEVYLEKWLGFVHIFGLTHQRGRDGEKADEVREKIETRAGMDLKPGPFQYAGRDLTAIEDDGLMRLGRLALAVISGLPRASYVRSVATGCLSESLMGYSAKRDLFSWIMSTARDSLWDEVSNEAQDLICQATNVTMRAAYHLLSFEGSRAAYNFRGTLPDDLFPPNKWLDELRKDPCTAGFSWSKENTKECIWRTDLEAKKIAWNASPFCTDPDLEGPKDLGERLTTLIDEIKVEEIDIVPANSSSDLTFDRYESVLCLFNPSVWANLVRLITTEIPKRQGRSLSYLSHRMVENSLILDRADYAIIFDTWKERFLDSGKISDDDLEAEHWLFLLVLKGLDAKEQLHYLLARDEQWHDLLLFADIFEPPSSFDHILLCLSTENSLISQRRLLWYISTFSDLLSSNQLQQFVTPWLQHEDSLARSLAMKTLFFSKDLQVIQNFVDGSWKWHPKNDQQENHWGSLLLCEFGGDQTINVLRKRIHPTFLGYAVQCRGSQKLEVGMFAEDVNLTLNRIVQSHSAVPTGFPEVEIEVPENTHLDLITPIRSRLATEPYSSESVSFVMRDYSWGGQADSGTDLTEFEKKRKEFYEGGLQEKLLQLVDETRQKQIEAENHWFLDRFHEESLDKVIELHPDLIDNWINLSDSDEIYLEHPLVLASSFYTALCCTLLRMLPDKGLDLLKRINQVPGVTSEVDFDTGINRLDLALFNAKLESDVVLETWQHKLDDCLSDYEVLRVTFAAQRGTGSDWLKTYIDNKLTSPSPLGFSRAVTSLGFCDTEHSFSKLEAVLKEQPNTWRRDVAMEAYNRSQQNCFAKHWFTRFFKEERQENAWAAFRLFLRCVDTRFWLWRNSVIDSVSDNGISESQIEMRKAYLLHNKDTIRNRVRKNESKLKETLYGTKRQEKGIWPWV